MVMRQAKSALISRREVISGVGSLALLGATSSSAIAKTQRKALQPSPPFSLRRHDGAPFHSGKDFAGRPFIVYFGFTYCPDICPTSLSALASALDAAKAGGAPVDEIGFALVTLDPERDTPEALAEYVSLFHPNLIGLYGEQDEIDAVARSWNVTYERTGEGDDYLISHPAYAYALDRDHRVVDYLWHIAPTKKLAKKISLLI